MNPPMDDEALRKQIEQLTVFKAATNLHEQSRPSSTNLPRFQATWIGEIMSLFQEQKASSERLATKEAYELLYWKYKELNHQSVDMKFAEAYGILMEALQKPEERTDV